MKILHLALTLSCFMACSAMAGAGFSVTVKQGDHGTVKDISGTYKEGDQLSFEAEPDPGYVLTTWIYEYPSGTPDMVPPANPLSFTVPALDTLRAITILPIFDLAPEPFTLTIDAVGGTVTGADSGDKFPPGTEISLTATAAPGYAFVGWEDAEGHSYPDLKDPSNPNVDLVLDADTHIVAKFRQTTIVLTEPTPTETANTPTPTDARIPAPHINVGKKGGNDARFLTHRSTGVIKGIGNETVDTIVWKLGSKTGQVKVKANGTWAIKLKGLQPGVNSLIVYGIDKKTGRRTDVHKTVVIYIPG